MKLGIALFLIGILLAGCGSSGSRAGSPPTTIVSAQTRTFTNPASSMEPTLHCAKPAPGCLAREDDRLIVKIGGSVKPGEIVVFRAPREAAIKCGAAGIYVKRILGVSGDTVHEDAHGFIEINGERQEEPYLSAQRRLADSAQFGQRWHVPSGEYFMLGDNRSQSCDSRSFGSVPQRNIIGPVTKIVRPR